MTNDRSETPPYRASKDSDLAWEDYLQSLREGRERFLSHGRCRDEAEVARATYDMQMLAASGFNFYVGARRSHPNFYIHPMFMPVEIAWGHPAPDYIYRWAILDGRNTYRVWGQRGTTRWTDLQVLNGFWGDVDMQAIHLFNLDEHTRPDGSFEIIFSPDPQPGGHWVEIPRDRRNVFLQCREAWWDWENETALKMQIEPLKIEGGDQWVLSEAEMTERLREATRWIRKNTDFNINQVETIAASAGGRNRFWVQRDDNSRGGHPASLKIRMIYDFAPDEAVIVEFTPPQALYWSLSISDIWYQTPDYSYHQSSLNGFQAKLDADGRFRAVLALEDPGVANWIDTVGLTQGMVNCRFYRPPDDFVPEPVVRKVKAREVRSLLPATTAQVSPQERQAMLARRARAALARYGY